MSRAVREALGGFRCRFAGKAVSLAADAARLVAVVAVLCSPASAGLDSGAAEEAVRGLAAESYAEREAAAEKLVDGGPLAVDALAAATGSSRPERAVRAMSLLGEVWVAAHARGDWETVERVVEALQRLREERSRPAVFADAVFRRFEPLEDDRMIAMVASLGGVVKLKGPEDDLLARYVVPGAGGIRGMTSRRPVVDIVYLGPKWTGGEAGLDYVRRLPLEQATVYFTPRDGLTGEMLNILRRDHPNLEISQRGPTKLGVTCVQSPDGTECKIDRVTPGGAAERAGLRPRDLIISFGGAPVATFTDLVEAIEGYLPGDEVEVRFERDGEVRSAAVTMRGWGDE